MRSATELLLNKTNEEVWYRGEDYVDSGRVNIIKSGEKEVKAAVRGAKRYVVNLKFTSGGISRECNCPYADRSSSYSPICKHMVAVAIVWDEMRSIARPVKEEIKSYAIAPPLISRAQINALYRNPLKADLEILRVLADETALGGKPRPHSRLPKMPHFNTDKNRPLSLKEVQKAFREIEGWTNYRMYDIYFCADEMVAAFCEVMRIIKKRLVATSPFVGIEILREAQKFHYKFIMELIDDSEGLHEFTEAHLEDVYQSLKKFDVLNKEKAIFNQRLQKFNEHRDDY